MARWTFEPGHSDAQFRARHMMVTWVRGHCKNVRGTLEFDPDDPAHAKVEAVIPAAGLWSGEPDRDTHLKSADFLDVQNHPEITFRSSGVERTGSNHYRVTGDLSIRGVTKEASLDVTYLGQWDTPFWEDGVDKGPVTRSGFVCETRINRHDFGVSWNAPLDKGGIVVGHEVFLTIDVEALRDKS